MQGLSAPTPLAVASLITMVGTGVVVMATLSSRRRTRHRINRIKEAYKEAIQREKPISDLYKTLHRGEGRRYSAVRGVLRTAEPVVSPIKKEECVAFASAVFQQRSNGELRVVASVVGVAPSVFRVAEKGQKWEAPAAQRSSALAIPTA